MNKEAERPDPDTDPYGVRLWDLEQTIRNQQRGIREKLLLVGLLVLLIIAIFLNALSFRYHMAAPRADLFGVYIIDNWTGRVWLCAGRGCGLTTVKP